MLATLIRLLGDFDRAEEAMQEAFAAAIEQWPRDGVPENPRAWLVSAARFKGIDAMRKVSRIGGSYDTVEDLQAEESAIPRARPKTRSRTTGCASSSPAAIPRSRRTRRSP